MYQSRATAQLGQSMSKSGSWWLTQHWPPISHTTMSDNLLSIYRHCIRHVDSVQPADLRTYIYDHDGDKRWLCSHTVPQPLIMPFSETPVTTAPIIFEITGQIKSLNNVTEMRNHDGELKKAAFWVECRQNRASRALWGQVPQSLALLSSVSESYLSPYKLLEIDNDSGTVRLRIVWSANEALGETVSFQANLNSLILTQSIDHPRFY